MKEKAVFWSLPRQYIGRTFFKGILHAHMQLQFIRTVADFIWHERGGERKIK